MPRSPEEAVRFLRTTQAIRDRCGNVLEVGLAGRLEHFAVDVDRIADVARFVAEVTRERYPDLQIPPHGRWQHFQAGGVDRGARLEGALDGASREELGRSGVELVVTSVLLDAGAGDHWSYHEQATGQRHARSEGLAVASFHAFLEGAFSSDPKAPARADADGLAGLDDGRLGAAFQISDDNHLVGLEGRASLLRQVSEAIRAAPEVFGESGRLGGLFDHLAAQASGGTVRAHAILDAVLRGLGPIWPGRISLGGVNLGDVWQHTHAGGEGHGAGLVPFHKLSQWLTYSLIHPLERAGLRVTGVDELTALAEYRNGGLLVDGEVLIPKHEAVTQRMHPVADEITVEWRALTVALLDRVAEAVRQELGVGATEMPLAAVLEGGTWHAGRRMALERRPHGGPPVRIQSDGTVF